MLLELPQFTLDQSAEISLARRVEAGVFAEWLLANGHDDVGLIEVVADGTAARDELFTANLRLVAQLSRNWAKRFSLDLDDLFQEGCLGLGEAIMRFDHTRGTRFSTLAWHWITNRVSAAALNRCGEIEAPIWRLRARRAVRAVEAEMTARLNRQPSVEELASRLNRSSRWVEDTLGVGQPPAALLTDVAIEEAAEEGPPTEFDLRAGFRALNELELAVIVARHGIGEDPMSLRATAEHLGLSRSTVRRIEATALGRLRRRLQHQAKECA